MDSIIVLSISVQVIIVALFLRYKREVRQAHLKENAFSVEKIDRDRYIVRNVDDPITFSASMFQKEIHGKDVEISRSNFTTGLLTAKNHEEVLILLKTRLLEAFKLRKVYETTLASSKGEEYRESLVMGASIDRLRKYEHETDLVYYSALLLDAFDKDREYKYGLSENHIYKTRYIFGDVQVIVEEEISLLESFEESITFNINSEKKKIELGFNKLYSDEIQV